MSLGLHEETEAQNRAVSCPGHRVGAELGPARLCTEVASFLLGVLLLGWILSQVCRTGPGFLLAFPLVWGAVLRGRGDPKDLSEAINVSASSFFFLSTEVSPVRSLIQWRRLGVWDTGNHRSHGCVLGTPCKFHVLQGTCSLALGGP